MTPRTLLLALLAPCLLAACANETTIPEATDAAVGRAAATAASTPAAPVTAFDGSYGGRMTLNPDRTRACPAAAQEDRTITVRQGRASFLIEPAVRHVLTGAVGASGDVRMSDSLDRTIATTGIFANDRFQGEHRNGLCSYTVLMNKRGG
ncbi:hypothetical protein E2C06_33335 [Dankookia rubra]|uniref:Lipoprotein n=1 Tax=Dankookia rubra TaxID=1442381 RepID=A0A4R5Q6H5_9PROT|nr:hypothetical protein [Dankookia rubra]TDH58296.1 hypothetical protein E2C06_33335 [Dankookia rubra]